LPLKKKKDLPQSKGERMRKDKEGKEEKKNPATESKRKDEKRTRRN
jgi:hypothetical protein